MSRLPTQAEADAARASLARKFIPCSACGDQQAGPLHRTSTRLWRERAERARRSGGTDPVSGVTADDAERHLAAIGEEEQ